MPINLDMDASLSRRHALAWSLAVASSAWTGCAMTPEYRPQRGQMGKDVMWLPTSERLTEKMLQLAEVGPQDLLFDLGAGDGVIPIYAARTRGLRAVGIEYNPKLAEHARLNVQRAGLQDRVRIITGDIFAEDFSAATVVTLYLLPELNQQLRPTLLQMKPGTRVVSNTFDMGDWEPDASHEEGRESALMWVIPSSAAGTWALQYPERRWNMALELRQRYQKVGGQLSIDGVVQPILGAQLRGAELRFVFIGPDEGTYSVKALIDGSALKAEVMSYGRSNELLGQRVKG